MAEVQINIGNAIGDTMSSILWKSFFCLFLLLSLSASASTPGAYDCNYGTDKGRGIQVVRAIFNVSENGVGCLHFYENKYSVASSLSSCGNFERVGKRRGLSFSFFSGYFDFTEKSHISIPRAENKRFVLIELGTDDPRLEIWSDNRHKPDISYVCTLRE